MGVISFTVNLPSSLMTNSPLALFSLVSKKLTESFIFIKHDLRILLLSKFISTIEPLRPWSCAMLPSKLSEGSFEYDGGNFDSVIDRIGTSPLPPYINRDADSNDKKRYQTVYASNRGAVAAPTAGLHFTEGLLKKAKDKGTKVENVTLHIGLGTFRPVQVEDLNRHQMDSEYFEVSPDTAMAINQARKKHRKIIAVGTSTVRALETIAISGFQVTPKRGWTDKFIYPPYDFKICSALITNLHSPKSTLLMMASAFGGFDLVMKAYKIAIKKKYMFHTYGDAILII